MDDERKRKKYTLYLHPEKAADFQTLEAIESVPRSERGELFECIYFWNGVTPT